MPNSWNITDRPIVELVQEIVDSIRPEGVVQSRTDNGDGTLTIFVLDTFGMVDGDYVQIDFGSGFEDFEVSNLVEDVSFDITRADAVPGAYKRPTPYFFKGTPKRFNADFTNIRKPKQKAPGIWLVTPFPIDYNSEPLDVVGATPQLRMVFYAESLKNWTEQEHDDLIEQIGLTVEEFLRAARVNPYVNDIDVFRQTTHANYGTLTTDQGHRSYLVAHNLDAIILELNMPIKKTWSECSKEEPQDRCEEILQSVTTTERVDCVLPTIDFSEQESIDALTPDQITDLQSALCGMISLPVVYDRNVLSPQISSRRLYDEKWHIDAGNLNDPYIPGTNMRQSIDFGADPTGFTLAHDNAFGNKFRFTNLEGDKLTNSTTQWEDSGVKVYMNIDHLQGVIFAWKPGAGTEYGQSFTDAEALVVTNQTDLKVLSDFRLATVRELYKMTTPADYSTLTDGGLPGSLTNYPSITPGNGNVYLPTCSNHEQGVLSGWTALINVNFSLTFRLDTSISVGRFYVHEYNGQTDLLL